MTYATPTAISRANAAGLNLSPADWREIFLAITDEVSSDPPTAQSITASFVGAVRDGGERWHIMTQAREFDVIYDPVAARIVLVLRPRGGDAKPAIVPNPIPPLRGKVAERVMVDA